MPSTFIHPRYPLTDQAFVNTCKQTLDTSGVLHLPQYLKQSEIDHVITESETKMEQGFWQPSTHNVYLSKPDPAFAQEHPRNREVFSNKGCLTDDQISQHSPLRLCYQNINFRQFLCQVLGIEEVYPYADPLSSINLHFARRGEGLGWHFDNSSFAITLMIRPATAGGVFQYVPNLRNHPQEPWGFEKVVSVLDGKTKPQTLVIEAGDLLLFRGRNALHQVTPNQGDTTRILAVLAYNTEPDIALSPTAQQTFYGRVAN